MDQLPLPDRPTGGEFAQRDPARRLLRSVRTKAFLAKDDTWTNDIQKAVTLPSLALPENLRGTGEEFEIYYSFDEFAESRYDFTLPVH